MHSFLLASPNLLLSRLTDIIKPRWLVLALVGLVFSPPPHADETEYKIKAGYLYNFTKFITWPQDQSPTFNICILGDDPFGELIDPIEQYTAFGKKIRLFRIENNNALISISKSTQCHILFISSSLETWPSTQKVKNVLIVGEGENFARDGGMVGFVNANSRIKLQINPSALQHSELKISAKLFEVAEIIEGRRWQP